MLYTKKIKFRYTFIKYFSKKYLQRFFVAFLGNVLLGLPDARNFHQIYRTVEFYTFVLRYLVKFSFI